MSDMMRVAGRTEQGTAQALKVDGYGRIESKGEINRKVWDSINLPSKTNTTKLLNRDGYKYSLIDFLFKGSFTLEVIFYRQPVEGEGSALQRVKTDEYKYEGEEEKYHQFEIELSSDSYTYRIINDNDYDVSINSKDTNETLTNHRQLVLQEKREVISLYFGGVLFPRVDGIETITSDNVDISHLKNIQIFMINSVRTTEPSSIAVLSSPTQDPLFSVVYDWNTEEWMSNGTTDGGGNTVKSKSIKVPYNQLSSTAFHLTTHPDLYWVKDFKGNMLQIRFKTNVIPEEGASNTVRVWITGDKL